MAEPHHVRRQDLRQGDRRRARHGHRRLRRHHRLQGILDTGAAKDRFAGLEESLKANTGVELLDQQTANFSRAEALDVTKTLLAKHGDKIKGIWAANDDMALGALEA